MSDSRTQKSYLCLLRGWRMGWCFFADSKLPMDNIIERAKNRDPTNYSWQCKCTSTTQGKNPNVSTCWDSCFTYLSFMRVNWFHRDLNKASEGILHRGLHGTFCVLVASQRLHFIFPPCSLDFFSTALHLIKSAAFAISVFLGTSSLFECWMEHFWFSGGWG